MKQLILPLQKLRPPLLWQSQKVQKDADREINPKFAHEFTGAAVLELVDVETGAFTHQAVEFHHPASGEHRIQRRTESGMRRWIKFCRDDVPTLADHLRESAIASLVEMLGIGVDVAKCSMAADHPTRLGTHQNIVRVKHSRPLVNPRDQRGVRILVNDLTVEQVTVAHRLRT